jgi:hypothetical protein
MLEMRFAVMSFSMLLLISEICSSSFTFFKSESLFLTCSNFSSIFSLISFFFSGFKEFFSKYFIHSDIFFAIFFLDLANVELIHINLLQRINFGIKLLENLLFDPCCLCFAYKLPVTLNFRKPSLVN